MLERTSEICEHLHAVGRNFNANLIVTENTCSHQLLIAKKGQCFGLDTVSDADFLSLCRRL